jgi:hypothetical protein
MRRARRNGPKATKKHGKPRCVALPQVSPLSSLFYSATDSSADSPDISKSIVNHVQTSLARAPYNIDDFGAYQAAALSVRDNLIVSDDLLGYLKITARTPSPHAHDNWRLLCRVHDLSPSAFMILGVSAMKFFDYRSVQCTRIRCVES